MDLSNTTGENTDYRVVTGAGSHSGTLRARSFTREIPLPPGGSWTIEFFPSGSRSRIATQTIDDSSSLVILVEAENGDRKILVARDEAQEVNEERLELLTRKYGNKSFSAEDEARLEALTEKVRRLIPRVTEKDWQALEEVTSRLDAIEERTRSIRKKYGLSG